MLLVLTLAPFLMIGVGALLLMLVEVMSRPRGMALGATLIFVAGGMSAIALWFYGPENLDTTSLAPWLSVDRFSLFFDGLLCLGGGLAALLAGGYMPEHNLDRGEFYSLLLFATFGAMMLAGAGDLLTLFLGLETMSIGAYAMTAFRRASPRSAEGGLKYFSCSDRSRPRFFFTASRSSTARRATPISSASGTSSKISLQERRRWRAPPHPSSRKARARRWSSSRCCSSSSGWSSK